MAAFRLSLYMFFLQQRKEHNDSLFAGLAKANPFDTFLEAPFRV